MTFEMPTYGAVAVALLKLLIEGFTSLLGHVRRYKRTLIIIFYLLANLSMALIGSREIRDTSISQALSDESTYIH